MRSLSRISIAPAVALALAAASLVAPVGAQELRRPVPHGAGGPRAGATHAPVPQAGGRPGGAAPRGFASPAGVVGAQQPRRGGNGAGVAAGVLGGLAAGAILGGILSNGAAAPIPGPQGEAGGCPVVRRPVYDGAGQFAGYQAVPSC